MFPSNPWIPYKLREIDLSYNSMPLLTYDLVFGTSKVEKLNMSHNSIADIRRSTFKIFCPKNLHFSNVTFRCNWKYNQFEDIRFILQ